MGFTTNNNMPQGYTLQQLQQMGGKPGTGKTFQELQNMGGNTFPTSEPETVKKSFWQKLGSVAGAVGNALTSSEQTLGRGLSTVGSAIPGKVAAQAAQNTDNVSKLLQVYHNTSDSAHKTQLANLLKSMGTEVKAEDINSGFGISNKELAGATLGTILDVASAGSYGKAASGAASGKLLTKGGGVVENIASKVGIGTTKKVINPVAEQVVKKTLTQTLGNIGLKTAERSAVGAATGYGYDVSSNLQSGKSVKESFKPGAGMVLGGSVPLAIGAFEAGKAITKAEAPRIINSLVKPKQADFAYGHNPGRTVSEMGITGNSLQEFGDNIGQAKQEVGNQIGNIYSNPENINKTIDAQKQIKRIDDAMAKAANGGKNNQNIVTTLQNLKDALLYEHSIGADGSIIRSSDIPQDLSKLSLKDAFELKQKVAEATQFTGRASDDKAVNAVLKNIYGGLSEQLTSAVSDTNPEILNLNQKYGDLTSAEIAVKNRDKIIQRSNMISLKTGGAGAVTTAVALLSGAATLPAALIGISGAVLEKALETPAVKTRLAAWLGSETPSAVQKVLAQNPQIKTALYRALPKFGSVIGK